MRTKNTLRTTIGWLTLALFVSSVALAVGERDARSARGELERGERTRVLVEDPRVDSRLELEAERQREAGETDPINKIDPPTGLPQLVGVVVTSVDPDEAIAKDARGFRVLLRDAQPFGITKGGDVATFDARETMNLYVIPLFDRRDLGEESFDLRARFILPDGNTYEKRVVPYAPLEADEEGMVKRSDLSPHPVEAMQPKRVNRLQHLYADAEAIKANDGRNTAFASIPLPVLSTWITKHQLYGEWTVELDTVQNGEVTSKAKTTFVLGTGDKFGGPAKGK